jgi:histidine triad (HIT) family protein
MTETIFTKIINREMPGYFIHEDEHCVVILDISPAVIGQSLVIPKKPVDYLFALETDVYTHIMCITRHVARVLDAELKTLRTCAVVEGFEVPHAHIKLYPVHDTTPLGRVLPQQKPADAETLTALAERLKSRVASTSTH